LIFDVVQHSDLKIDWYHFGDGPLLENIKKRVKSKRADLTIHFKGHVENAQLLEFYKFQSIDLFINLSTTEGVPVSIMEALSFGIPVLAPNIGGIGELVNDTNGKLISVDLPLNEIVKELTNLLQAENRNELRNKARLTFETKASAEANYSNFYSELNRL
jgi:glycosyltransferase involved in cell wall biosynthesis